MTAEDSMVESESDYYEDDYYDDDDDIDIEVLVTRRIKELEEYRDRQIECSRINFERLRQNAQDLANFEKREAEAAHNVAIHTIKEVLCDNLDQRIKARQQEIEKSFGVSGLLTPPVPTPLTPYGKRKKSLLKGRKVPPKDAQIRIQVGVSSSLPPSVSVQLTDYEIRADFAAILADWKSRAISYMKVCKNIEWCHVEFFKDEQGKRFMKMNDTTYKVGDRVKVTSNVTREEFFGKIVAIELEVLYVVLIGDIRCNIHADQLRRCRLQLEYFEFEEQFVIDQESISSSSSN